MKTMVLESKNGKRNRGGVIFSGSNSITNSIFPHNRSHSQADRHNAAIMSFDRKISTKGRLVIGVEKAENGCSSRKRYRTQRRIRRSEKVRDEDEEYSPYKRGNSSGRKRRNSVHRRNNKTRRKGIVLVQSSGEAADEESSDDFTPYTGKRTILSWLIDSGTVLLNGCVQHLDWTNMRTLLTGKITKDGLLCDCCQRIMTVAEFEVHAGCNLCQPYQNTFLETGNGTGISFLQCQLNAWHQLEKSTHCGSHIVECHMNDDDPSDDLCGICADGGDLICCDSCPSTFHQSCLGIQMLPQGDWHCANCICKFCRLVDPSTSQLLTCRQCEKKYHQGCTQETEVMAVGSNGFSFCGDNCRKLFEQLKKLIGVKNVLKNGLSWTLLQNLDHDQRASLNGLSARAECYSKLAIAFLVMEECFSPITDRRSGRNIIQSVILSLRSNTNRLNFSGFYTAVLERGDEIISAASIRIHGTKLAEMPFIGTRNAYRCQGMCHQLLNAIESTLCSLNVKKLIIPSIYERVDKWTRGFGFKPIEKSLKQEMSSMNLLMFPDTVLLQKPLLKHDASEGNKTAVAAVEAIELQSNDHQNTLNVVNKSLLPDLNFPPPRDNGITWDGKPRYGVFLTLDSQGGLKITRLRIRD